MKALRPAPRLPAPAGTSAAPPSCGASRAGCGVKIHPPLAASNGAFIRAWAARRAKLAAGAMARASG